MTKWQFWWLIVGHCLCDQNWSYLVWSFIAFHVVINLVINVVIYLVIDSKYITKLMTYIQAINDPNKYDQFWSRKQ